MLLVVYLFTVFHKLNTGFFDPSTSCAGDLLARLTWLHGLAVRPGAAVVAAAAVATVLVEVAVLVCLAVSRWRHRGVLLGVGFHTVLAAASFSHFTTVVLALQTEEGRSNHLLPGVTAVELASYQRDTVVVSGIRFPDRVDLGLWHRVLGGRPALELQTPWTREEMPVRLPWHELRRTVLLWADAGIHGVALDYVRDGVLRGVSDAVTDPVLAAPLPWGERNLLAFRAVESGFRADRCRW